MAGALLREGRLVEAEAVLAREVQAVTAKHGRGSPAWASAQCDLGNILINADQLDRAIECYRNAVTVAPNGDPQHRKDHLTYRLNLGLALRLAGRLDEAEAELHQGAEARLAFYGRDHAGYAFGLEPLADVLLLRGNVAQARQVIDEAVGTFWRNGHERVATALALRAEILHAGDSGEPLFADLDRLPDDIVEQVVGAALRRVGQVEPATSRDVITHLVATLEARLGPDSQATLNALSTLANLGSDLGDHAGRIDAIQRVLASYQRQGRAEEVVMAALGLAMAQGDAGDAEGGLRTYAMAYSTARPLDRPELTSQVLRNWGLALNEAGQAGPAEQRLSEAVAQARRGADYETLGRAQVALGLFLQHEGRLAEAQATLDEALSILDPAHPDTMIGRSHLGAVLAGRTCGCGDLEDTVADAFRQFVLSKLPPGLLTELDVALQDGDFQIKVELRREPTEEELERLNGVMRSAYAEFRRRIAEPRYTG